MPTENPYASPQTSDRPPTAKRSYRIWAIALAICTLGASGLCALLFIVAAGSALDWPPLLTLIDYDAPAIYGACVGLIGAIPLSVICSLAPDKFRIAYATIGGLLWAVVTSIGCYLYVYTIANA